MSELFPELSKDIVKYILIDGVRIDETDRDHVDVMKKLYDLGIVQATKHSYVKCAYRKDYDYPYVEDSHCEGEIEVSDENGGDYCPQCGRPIEDLSRKTKFAKYKVTLDPQGIESHILNILETSESVSTCELTGAGTFNALIENEMQLRIVLSDITPKFRNYDQLRNQTHSRSAGFFFAEPTLYVIASPINEPARSTPLEQQQYIGLSDLLSKPKDEVDKQLRLASVPIEECYSFSEIERRFSEMMARHPREPGEDGWQFGEQEFFPALLCYITENPGLVDKYLQRLEKLSDTVFNFYHVPVGGGGKPDFISIDKFELMSQIFQDNIEGEVKFYGPNSTLSDNSMKTVVYHLNRNKSGAIRSILFVTSDKVASTAWIGMMEMKKDGKWPVIIVPKYLILEIIAALKADYLLDM